MCFVAKNTDRSLFLENSHGRDRGSQIRLRKGLRRRYSYGNPIGRKGVVVPINVHHEHSDLVPAQIPSQYALSSRRIRDPSAVRYHHSRTSPRVQQWMMAHGADAPNRNEHPTPSVARYLQHQFEPRLPSPVEREFDAYHHFSPRRDTEFHSSSVSSARGTADLGPMQWRPLEIPVGIPRFQRKPMEDTFVDPLELEWNTISHPNDQATFLGSRGGFLRERSFSNNQGTDPSGGQNCHNVPFNSPSQQSFYAPQGPLPYARLEKSSLPSQRLRNNGYGLAPAQTAGGYHSNLYQSATVDQETSIQLEMNGHSLGYRHDGGFMRFRRPSKESDSSASYFAATSTIATDLSRQPYPTRSNPMAQPPLRFFNNGTEIDIDGMPLSRTWSSHHNDSRTSPTNRAEYHVTSTNSKDELGDLFDESARGINSQKRSEFT